jgi:hypothetical protein
MGESIEKADERELHGFWNTYHERRVWRRVIDNGGDRELAERALGDLADVSALDALEANRRLVDFLEGRRWYVIQDAREAGASWVEIGAALGMTKQGAQDWYRRRIADRERYVPEFHDAERARAVLND